MDTIDKYGLKKSHLGKHKRSAYQFLADVAALQCVTEAGTALKKRIEQNNGESFTYPTMTACHGATITPSTLCGPSPAFET